MNVVCCIVVYRTETKCPFDLWYSMFELTYLLVTYFSNVDVSNTLIIEHEEKKWNSNKRDFLMVHKCIWCM